MSMLREVGDGHYNPDMFKLAFRLRGIPARELAKLIGCKQKQIYQYQVNEEPTPDVMEKICEALYFPRDFFFRVGVVYERDPRYPDDMFVPLPLKPLPTREELSTLLQSIPEHELAALNAYMDEVAEYPDNVVRINIEE